MQVTTGIQTVPPLKALARQLRQADRAIARKLGKVNKAAAQPISDDARSRASGDTKLRARAAAAITAKGTAGSVAVAVSAAGAHPYAMGAFLGSKGHPQFWDHGAPNWVGADWVVGDDKEGPHDLNPAIAAGLDRMLEGYGDAFAEFWDEAFMTSMGDTA